MPIMAESASYRVDSLRLFSLSAGTGVMLAMRARTSKVAVRLPSNESGGLKCHAQ
jgi:hypothetical protein